MPIPPRTEEWEAPNGATGIKPIISTLLQVFQRDQAEALPKVVAAILPGEDLPEFVVFNKARRLNQSRPAISVIARREKPNFDSSSLVIATHKVDVEIEAKGSDSNLLADWMMCYVLGTVWMILQARVEDWTAELGDNFGALNIEIGEIDYRSFVDKTKTIYTDYAVVPVTVELLQG